jgi:hypothetical protein
MKRAKIKTPFESMSDADFETKAGSIYDSMLKSSYFPAPTPELPVILADLQAYSASLIAAKTKDKNAVAAKTDARDELTLSLIQLANSVSTIANGDRTKLITSGFDLAKPGESIPLKKPDIISLTDGVNAGELNVKVPSVKGAKAYGPQYTSDPLTSESEWTQFMCSTSKYTFKNLPSAQKIWCRMCVMGAYGQVVYSDAVCRVVQ